MKNYATPGGMVDIIIDISPTFLIVRWFKVKRLDSDSGLKSRWN